MSEINSNLKNLINLGPFEPKADQSYYILAAGNPNYALTANAYYSTKLQIQSQMSGFWQRKNKYCNGLTEKMSESSSQNKLVFQVFFFFVEAVSGGPLPLQSRRGWPRRNASRSHPSGGSPKDPEKCKKCSEIWGYGVLDCSFTLEKLNEDVVVKLILSDMTINIDVDQGVQAVGEVALDIWLWADLRDGNSCSQLDGCLRIAGLRTGSIVGWSGQIYSLRAD